MKQKNGSKWLAKPIKVIVNNFFSQLINHDSISQIKLQIKTPSIMKKTVTLLAFLIGLTAFSQIVQKEVSKKGTYGIAGGRTTEKVVQKSSQEKIYQNSNSCYSGIKYKVKNTGKFSGDTTNYSWWIMFTNTYKKPVAFSYRLLVGGTQFGGGTFLQIGRAHV